MKGIELESKNYHFRTRSDSFYFVIIILLCYIINNMPWGTKKRIESYNAF